MSKTLLQQADDMAEEPSPTIWQRVKCFFGKHDWELDTNGCGHVVRCSQCGKSDWSFVP